jgi:hypothetical protein
LISLPTDKTLWKTASAGFGLICGVAVIALMNQLNYLFYPVPDGTESEIAKAYFSDTFLLTGKLIAIIAGCFFAGAISRLLHSGIEKKFAVGIGFILMIPALIDLISAPYPVWYWVISLLLYVPASIAGFIFIERIQIQRTEAV